MQKFDNGPAATVADGAQIVDRHRRAVGPAHAATRPRLAVGRWRSIGAVLDLPRDDVERLCRQFGVTRLAVFGSAVTEAFDPERSDLDVLVEFADDVPDLFDAYFGLREGLEVLADRSVDLVMASAVRNPYVARSIAETQQDLYAA
jgi:predicted nucleotidyltransferase